MTVFFQRFFQGGDSWSVAVKDTIDVAGWPTKAGCRALDDAKPAERNADVVQAALDAGCRLVGKTNTHELAYGMTGLNEWAGTPVNHRYPDLIPGGSSSGSAVAVASALADFSIGTDTGGSIRVPAACCGVYGLKPTFGRISRRGAMPAETSLDCVGPFADSSEMLINAMKVLDPEFSPLNGLSEIRLGMVSVDVDPLIQSTVARFIQRTELTTEEVELTGMHEAFVAGMSLINAETFAACGHLLATGKVGDDVAQRLAKAKDTSPADIVQAEAVRARFTREVDLALETVTALVMPTLPAFPMSLADAQAGKTDLQISALVRPFNLSGHPALTIPLETEDQRPVGLQLVGRKGDDELLCELARIMSAFISQS
ncbi:amidase [Pontibacterium sp. N1Y112]|uniref:Amidase n=1 Tax=Pontibacterium sinense TaxID=2781979 RepID=A0A8J7FA63_9GAMM|nr:amidase [Pontibacterium sinense]MBE9397795.1 amidase [Pontibacterium sinense]